MITEGKLFNFESKKHYLNCHIEHRFHSFQDFITLPHQNISCLVKLKYDFAKKELN